MPGSRTPILPTVASVAASIEAHALWLTAARTTEIRTETVPPPGPHEVRVRAIASALSQGTEMLVYRGQVPADLPLDLPTLSGSFAFPIKYGYASVGRVLDAGSDVRHVGAGDAVFVLHPHQSAYTVPASLVVLLPNGLPSRAGLFTANVETAVNVLLDAPIKLGETAVVFGQGTVGLLIVQLLKRAGAARVIAVDPLPKRRDLASLAGADTVLAPGEELAERVRLLTAGRGADVTIEASGNGDALQAAIDTVAAEGTVMAVSWYGTKPLTLSLGGHFHRGRVRIRSTQVGRLDPALSSRWDHARRMALVLDLLPRLQLTSLITHEFPLSAAAEAYRLIDEHPAETGQVIITYTQPNDES
jgi:2-desacetyl-2-hydroxyethyl bacteriochlorophyllide A dehydrogenase